MPPYTPVLEDIFGALLLLYLFAGTICYGALTYLVWYSFKAPAKPPDHLHEGPEIVLVPMGGPMGPAPKPPTRH